VPGFVHLLDVGTARVILGHLGKQEIAEADDHGELILELVDHLVVRVGRNRIYAAVVVQCASRLSVQFLQIFRV
jgi:hypothetical protein